MSALAILVILFIVVAALLALWSGTGKAAPFAIPLAVILLCVVAAIQGFAKYGGIPCESRSTSITITVSCPKS